MKTLKFLSLKGFWQDWKEKHIYINVFCYENSLVYPVYVSDEKVKNYMDLLMKTSKNKSHYGYIKDFNKFIFNKAKCKNKKHFCKCCLQRFSSEIISVKHKETCLKINGKQTIKLRSGSIMQWNNVNKPSKFFRYLDANNLYGWAVNQYLPYSRFK